MEKMLAVKTREDEHIWELVRQCFRGLNLEDRTTYQREGQSLVVSSEFIGSFCKFTLLLADLHIVVIELEL
jgi:hypothetical protein